MRLSGSGGNFAGFGIGGWGGLIGGSKQNTCSFMRTPPMMPTHSLKYNLHVAGRMGERDDLHSHVAAGKAVFDPQPFENPLRRCLGGAVLSASRIASIRGTRGPSFGRSGCLDRTSPGGAEYRHILAIGSDQRPAPPRAVEPLRTSPLQTSPAAPPN
jgi:hypothetical protein